jgi:hypothetical protein
MYASPIAKTTAQGYQLHIVEARLPIAASTTCLEVIAIHVQVHL